MKKAIKAMAALAITVAAFVCVASVCSSAHSSSGCKACAVVPQKTIGREKAISIALNHAGVKRSDVRELDCELDRENGVLVYDIEFEVGNMEYDYDIDAKTGAVLKAWKERD